MTANQINYAGLVENRRHNVVDEGIKRDVNIESQRHNKAAEFNERTKNEQNYDLGQKNIRKDLHIAEINNETSRHNAQLNADTLLKTNTNTVNASILNTKLNAQTAKETAKINARSNKDVAKLKAKTDKIVASIGSKTQKANVKTQTRTQKEVANINAAASKYASDKSAESAKYSSDVNLTGVKYKASVDKWIAMKSKQAQAAIKSATAAVNTSLANLANADTNKLSLEHKKYYDGQMILLQHLQKDIESRNAAAAEKSAKAAMKNAKANASKANTEKWKTGIDAGDKALKHLETYQENLFKLLPLLGL